MSAVSKPAWLFLQADEDRLNRSCLVDELSGWQFVLVNEAVNLGIAIYNMRQGEGIRCETLFRDETVGALDAVNGKEYVRMLRPGDGPGRIPPSDFHISYAPHLGTGGKHPFGRKWMCGDGQPGSGSYH
jgi:hypothetical protein